MLQTELECFWDALVWRTSLRREASEDTTMKIRVSVGSTKHVRKMKGFATDDRRLQNRLTLLLTHGIVEGLQGDYIAGTASTYVESQQYNGQVHRMPTR